MKEWQLLLSETRKCHNHNPQLYYKNFYLSLFVKITMTVFNSITRIISSLQRSLCILFLNYFLLFLCTLAYVIIFTLLSHQMRFVYMYCCFIYLFLWNFLGMSYQMWFSFPFFVTLFIQEIFSFLFFRGANLSEFCFRAPKITTVFIKISYMDCIHIYILTIILGLPHWQILKSKITELLQCESCSVNVFMRRAD